ncbi:MAG: hypothetical protein FWD03_03570 [Defluviitaleaceae bacterium]|nr:hypothetical protein [Defluviitaleaceae bacterium]
MLNAAVIGSGSVFSPELVIKFAEIADKLGGVNLRFMDIDQPRQAIVSGLCRRLLKNQLHGDMVSITDYQNLEACITDADFVLLQLRQGGIDARIEDEKLGKKYKLPFTETISICGMATFLRTYYEYEKIAAAIVKLAPKAWVLNFTNPAGQMSETLSRLGVEKVLGVCNGVVWTKNEIEKKLGINPGTYTINWRGLNHLTVMDGIYHDGKNRINEYIEAACKDGSLEKQMGTILNGYFQYYFDRVEVIERLQQQEKVRSQIVKEVDEELLEEYKTADAVPEAISKRGGYGYSSAVVDIIRAICLDEGSVHHAVAKNGSCLPSLPQDAFVEIPIMVNKSGAFPIVTDDMPEFTQVLAIAIKSYERILIKAAMERDKKGMLEAMMTHPLLNCYSVAVPLLEDCLEVNRRYLPEIN